MTTETSPSLEGAVAPPPRKRRVFRWVKVTRVVRLSPRMVRVTFTGDDLGAFAWNGPAAHLKLIFPEEGQIVPIMPEPDGPRPARGRTYTPRRFDPTIPELDVELVLHGDGPGSSWAAQAEVGQVLILSGPGPNYEIDPEAAWFLLVGDDTAFPALQTILEALPAETRVRMVVEVVDEQEERPLPTAAQLDITWLHRGPDPAQTGVALEETIKSLQLPPGKGRIYVGCEAAVMRRIRRHLLQERGLDPAMMVTRGYWRLGAVNYTDRDYGQDDDTYAQRQ